MILVYHVAQPLGYSPFPQLLRDVILKLSPRPTCNMTSKTLRVLDQVVCSKLNAMNSEQGGGAGWC